MDRRRDTTHRRRVRPNKTIIDGAAAAGKESAKKPSADKPADGTNENEERVLSAGDAGKEKTRETVRSKICQAFGTGEDGKTSESMAAAIENGKD